VRQLVARILGIALAAGLGWLALTSFAPASSVATWAPCPRNWGWGDAWLPRESPLAAVRIRFTHGHGKLCYGRPSLLGRDVIGGAEVPWGRLWRTGANEPTTLHLDLPVKINELYLRPGSYSIYTVPGRERWTVIVNRSIGQWGLESEYTPAVEAHEVGRLTVVPAMLEHPVETLTIRAEPLGGDEFSLVLEWQTTRIRIPLDGSRDEISPDTPDREPF